MKFLIDECLHSSLIGVAQQRGHEAHHVNWLGLSGSTDRSLATRAVDEDFTFVTNNARDFHRLYLAQPLHAGLIIILRQVTPTNQRRLFDAVLSLLEGGRDFVNEVIEIELTDDVTVSVVRYELPDPGAG